MARPVTAGSLTPLPVSRRQAPYQWVVLTFLLCALPRDGASQVTVSTPEPAMPSVASLVRGLVTDVRRLPSVETAVTLGAGGGFAAALLSSDDEIVEHASRTWGRSSVFAPGDVIGELSVQGGGALATFAVGRILRNPRVASLGADLVRAQILNTVATHGTKALIDRRRPDGARRSFPSGHASSTFATAAVIQRHFGWKAGVPALALASFTGASRVARGQHYLSDVMFGAATGVVMGRTVTVARQSLRLAALPTRGGVSLLVTAE